jgi:hypothetical protein
MGKLGRPPIVATPEEFDARVDAYASQCKENDEPLTFTGMALALGFSERTAMYKYVKKEEFYHSVKRAIALVEAQYEKRLSGQNVAGAIFALKNHGWSDRQELEHTGAGGTPLAISITFDAEAEEPETGD